MREPLIIDCFAGGGGASVGIEMALGRSVDIAINHDENAIIMHEANHPETIHLTEDIFKVDLKKYIEDRKVGLLWASPDCTGYSKAKGSQPRSASIRMLPWSVYKHAKAISPAVIIMENVEEIQQWGPLDEEGKVIKERRGEEYQKFISAMKSLGYTFDSKELIAADYGAPTTRKRWYAIFRKDGKAIKWPEQTHSKDGNGLLKWVPCCDYIDWSDLGEPISKRTKPIAQSTVERINKGIERYVCSNPYIVSDKRAYDYLSKYYEKDSEQKMCTFITKYYHTCVGQPVTEPIHTITTSSGHFGLVTAFLIKYYGTGGGQRVTKPLATITTKDRFGLVSGVIEIDGEKYVLKDIFLRMLKPSELKLMQGFPEDYIIDRDKNFNKYPLAEQTARIGNSVVPIMAQKLVEVNCPELKIGVRIPNLVIKEEANNQLKFA